MPSPCVPSSALTSGRPESTAQPGVTSKMALRLLEPYPSTQGEGPNVGKLTQFVRFAGCNLKCPGWPCDTPFSIDPAQYRNEMQLVTARTLARSVFAEFTATGAENICLTGGEPTLQPQGELYVFLSD